MALFIYDIARGRLQSWSPEDGGPVAADELLAARGWAKVSGLPPLDESHVWDVATRTVIAVEAPATAREIAAWQFVLLFTPAEYAAIEASADPGVRQFLQAAKMAPTVDLNGATTKRAFAYLTSLGLLTADRAAIILSAAP